MPPTRRTRVTKQPGLGKPASQASRRSARVTHNNDTLSSEEQQAKINSLSSAVTALQQENASFQDKLDSILQLLQTNKDDTTTNPVSGQSSQYLPEQPMPTHHQGDIDTASVDEAVSDTASEGECEVTVVKESFRPKLSGALQIGSTVPFKLKKKIWSHKFVDFADLLDPLTSKNEYSLAFHKSGSDAGLKFKASGSKFLTETEWSMAWGVFMAIFLEKHKQGLNAMMSYQEYIHKLMRRQARWWAYDRQFRIDREHAMYPWDTIRSDLERDAFMPSTFRASNTQSPTSTGGNATVKPGT